MGRVTCHLWLCWFTLHWTRRNRNLTKKEVLAEFRSYTDIFDIVGMETNIFVIAEAGAGKTTLCKKLMPSWCIIRADAFKGRDETNTSFVADEKTKAASHFKYLFYVPLRHVKDPRMAAKAISTVIRETFPNHQDVIHDIMKECPDEVLVLLDGFDEYPGMLDYKEINRRCTVITSTRPWKYRHFCITTQALCVDAVVKIKNLTTDNVQRLADHLITLR